MKKSIYGFVIFTSIVLSACAQSRNIQEAYDYEPSNSISYQQFYDDLSPYGQWIDNPEFGNVWIPGERNGFRPYYSNGNWAYTNYGWTWVSNYNWGWATFHYGRWFYDNFYGWMWVPGYEWAPAWVNWRSNSQYYGWAPLCPRGRDGRYYEQQNDQWAFVPQQYINRRDINNYYVNRQNNTTIINNTTVVNNAPVRNFQNVEEYHPGPNVTEVEKVTRTRIKPLAIKPASQPGNPQVANGALRIYRPVVKSKDNNTTVSGPVRMSPGRVIDKAPDNNNTSVKPAAGNLNNVDPKGRTKPELLNNNKPFTNTERDVKQLRNQQIQGGQTDQSNQNNVTVPDKNRQVKQFQNDRPVTNDLPVRKEVPAQADLPVKNNAVQQKMNERQLPQESRMNNIPQRREVPERREMPVRNDAPRNNQQQRIMNERQQSPSNNQNQFNQRQIRERPVSNFGSPSGTVERKFPAEPNSSGKPLGKIQR